MITVILPKGLARFHAGQTVLTLPAKDIVSFREGFAEYYPELYPHVFPKDDLHPHFSLYLNGASVDWSPSLSFKPQDQLELLVGVSGG